MLSDWLSAPIPVCYRERRRVQPDNYSLLDEKISIRPFGPFAERKLLYAPPFGGARHLTLLRRRFYISQYHNTAEKYKMPLPYIITIIAAEPVTQIARIILINGWVSTVVKPFS